MTRSFSSRSGFAPTSGVPVGCCLRWLKDDALEDSANLPAPGIIAADIAADIVADLEAALEQFAAIEEDRKE